MSNNFKTMGTGLHIGLYSANNRWNHYMADFVQKKGVMVDFIGNIPQSMGYSIPLKTFGRSGDKSPRYDLQMARSTQDELSRLGLVLPSDYYSRHTGIMAAVNMITGLVYCSVLSRDKSHRTAFLCTKNLDVIKLLCHRHGIEYPVEAVRKYRDRFGITEEEVRSEVLNCVKISFSKGKIKLASAKVHVGSKATTLLPMYMIGFYADSVVAKLKQGITTIKVQTEDGEESIVASLDKRVLSRRTHVNPDHIAECVYSMNDMGSIHVFDLQKQGFVKINLLDIISITKRESK